MVEESPGIKRPGATELLSITLLDTNVKYRVSGTGGSPPNEGAEIRASVHHVDVQDLQGCVEHRRVLSANKVRSANSMIRVIERGPMMVYSVSYGIRC